MPATTQQIHVDIAIIGGGVAGLWLLSRARRAGYHAVLFEQSALGSGQSVASQGMIHGGVKYTLSGALSGASEAIADMPAHWRRCMAGEGDVDLRGVKILSDHFYMWSAQSVLSKATAFLASKALRGRVDALKPKDFPSLFRNAAFKGSLYKLVDLVLDVPSLLRKLSDASREYIMAIDWQHAQLQRAGAGAVISVQHDGKTFCINSQLCVLAAGKGNGDLLARLQVTQPQMQLRPLQQVMVRHKFHEPLYAHCVGTDSKPRLTISSHRDGDYTVWYLGGQLAEDGVNLSAEELIALAKTELQNLFSWLDWRDAEWATFCVDRAEPAQPGLLRPDNAWLSACDSLARCVVAWPTKLTLAPNLGNMLLEYLRQENIAPQFADAVPMSLLRLHEALDDHVACAPWRCVNWQRGA